MATCEKCGRALDDEYAKEWRWCPACRNILVSENEPNQSDIEKEDTPSGAFLDTKTVRSNGIGKVLKVIGMLVIIIGILFGFYMGAQVGSITLGLPFVLGGVTIGVLFVGIGEIIRLLQRIADNV